MSGYFATRGRDEVRSNPGTTRRWWPWGGASARSRTDRRRSRSRFRTWSCTRCSLPERFGEDDLFPRGPSGDDDSSRRLVPKSHECGRFRERARLATESGLGEQCPGSGRLHDAVGPDPSGGFEKRRGDLGPSVGAEAHQEPGGGEHRGGHDGLFGGGCDRDRARFAQDPGRGVGEVDGNRELLRRPGAELLPVGRVGAPRPQRAQRQDGGRAPGDLPCLSSRAEKSERGQLGVGDPEGPPRPPPPSEGFRPVVRGRAPSAPWSRTGTRRRTGPRDRRRRHCRGRPGSRGRRARGGRPPSS